MKIQDNLDVSSSIALTIILAVMTVFIYLTDPSGNPLAWIPGYGVIVGIIMTIIAANKSSNENAHKEQQGDNYYSIIKVPVNGFLDLDVDVQDFILNELKEDTHVYLRNEFANKDNKHTLAVMHRFSVLGYVDDKFCELIHRYLRKGNINAITVGKIKQSNLKKGHIVLNVYHEDKNGDKDLPYYPLEGRKITVQEVDLWNDPEDWTEEWSLNFSTDIMSYKFKDLLHSEEAIEEAWMIDCWYIAFVKNYLSGCGITKGSAISYCNMLKTDEAKEVLLKRIDSFMNVFEYSFAEEELYDDEGNSLTETEENNDEESSTEDSVPMERKTIRVHLNANLETFKFIQQCLADQEEGNSKCYIIKATGNMISVMGKDFCQVFEFESDDIANYLNGNLAAAGFPKVYTDDMSNLQVDVLVIPAEASNDEIEIAHVHYEMNYLVDPVKIDYRCKTIMDGKMNLNLVGIQYRDNYKELIETLKEGMTVVLRPEHTNEFDPNALAFYYNDIVIGYLPKKDQPFAHIFLAKGHIEATIYNIEEEWIDTEVVITKDMIDSNAYENNGVRFAKIESFKSGTRKSKTIELSDFIDTL